MNLLIFLPPSKSWARKLLAELRPIIVESLDLASIEAFNRRTEEAEDLPDLTPEVMAVQGIVNVPPVPPIVVLSFEGGEVAL